MKLKKVCAWCGKTIHEGSSPDAPITHGICDPCLLTHFHFTREQLNALHTSHSALFVEPATNTS